MTFSHPLFFHSVFSPKEATETRISLSQSKAQKLELFSWNKPGNLRGSLISCLHRWRCSCVRCPVHTWGMEHSIEIKKRIWTRNPFWTLVPLHNVMYYHYVIAIFVQSHFLFHNHISLQLSIFCHT
jgi:hypothetical protein